ncbi:MAG TPA: efflux transporter outer membrane subunit [Steroidobacteraceae bacterium]|nr:efflux transporter outer membrane subunit [Steroidobacteraceae bacterium]
MQVSHDRATPRGRAARLAGLMLAWLAPTACTVGPDFVRPAPPVPAHWPPRALQGAAQSTPEEPAASAAAAPGAVPGERIAPASIATEANGAQLASWWTQFGDAELDSLTRRALSANLDLRVAMVRTEESLAQRDIVAAAHWPDLSANASYDLERISETTPNGALLGSVGRLAIPGVGPIHIPNPYDQYQLGASVAWELDLFGRVRRTLEASNAAAQVSLENQRAVQVSLLAQLGHSYVVLRGAQSRRALALAHVATLQDLLQLTQQRFAAGLVTELDERNAQAQLSQTRAMLPGLDLQIDQAIHTLGNLLGADPEALRAELAQTAAMPPVPPSVPIGLPAELVRRRPDIREAEANLHAATAQIGVAVGSLFPRLSLSGVGGFQSDAAGKILRWSSLFTSIGPQLQVPIFDRGAWRTVTLERLRAKEAALSYQSVVLGALAQVEDSLAAYAADQRQGQWLTDTVAQNGVAVELARARYASGVSDFLSVLDTVRTLQQNQMSLLACTTAVNDDLVALYRALGGGW